MSNISSNTSETVSPTRTVGAVVLLAAFHVGVLLSGSFLLGLLQGLAESSPEISAPPTWLGGVLTVGLGLIVVGIAVPGWGEGWANTINRLKQPISLRDYRHGFFFALLAYFISALAAAVITELPFMPGESGIEEAIEMFPQGLLIRIILLAVLVPIIEEIIYRGIILHRLLEVFSPRTAVLVSAIIFAIIHLDPVQSIYTFLMGLLIGWIYIQSRRLKLVIWIHIAFNGYGTLLSELGLEEMGERFLTIYSVAFLAVILIFGSRSVRYFQNRTKYDQNRSQYDRTRTQHEG
ncbi:MAG: CPBP family intramembrane glutamic endopeptidase [Spirochaeta sp.]